MKKLLISITLVIPISIIVNAQVYLPDYIFFDDSPTSISYDPSWSFVKPPSLLEKVGEKFPVVSDFSFQGNNCLKLHWTSNVDGDWGFAVAKPGWPGHDVTQRDTLSFWVYADTIIPSIHLPLVYLEDLSNKKTDHFGLSQFSLNIPDSQWTVIKVPLQVFIDNPGQADLTKIKTVFYGQDADDGIEHTMLIDEIRMYSGTLYDTIPPSTPQNLTSSGYYKHIDIFWEPVLDIDLNSYNIYRSLDGLEYTKIGSQSREFTIYTDWVRESGQTFYYKVSAIDQKYNESDLSASTSSSTQELTDDELLTMVQEATFRYFWNYAHPVSGLARERTLGNPNTVTIGGSGFGVMAILVGIERGFITREEGAEHLLKILNFITSADRFHGAWPHWMNGETGEVIPFTEKDDGGDLVETAFMIQGLLAARQYFDQDNETEKTIDSLITYLWETVEWDWYRKDSGNYLFWHWSPNYGWEMNFPLIGWNETMITYILAIASPTHSIPAILWEEGWASSEYYDNGNYFCGIPIWVGWDYGGPLFFTHYSFLGFDPHEKKDSHTNYFKNNVNTTLVNRAYCIDNPGGYAGYGKNCWGLTASDDPLVGYLAHEPTPDRDNGTIAPTAALSAFPYTPEYSMNALKHFYNEYGENIWDIFGFTDAFNLTHNWYDAAYLAIDQGPIVVMIENYQTGLLWEKFMANPEIQPALNNIGFVIDTTTAIMPDELYKPTKFKLIGNYPNPFNPNTTILFTLPQTSNITLKIYDLRGGLVKEYSIKQLSPGYHSIQWDGKNFYDTFVSNGIYIYTIENTHQKLSGKMTMIK